MPAIDGFRAYAVVAIVALHTLGFSEALPGPHRRAFELVAWGTLGNALAAFFIISGFALMLGVFARGGNPGPLSRFYAMRAVRIYPAYWLTLLLALALISIKLPPPSVVSHAGISSPAEVVVQFAGLQMPARMFDASMPVGFGVDPVLWFVSVILGFYLLFPLIARSYSRHPLVGLTIAAAITVGWVWSANHLLGIFTAVEGHNGADWVVRLIAVEQLPGWAFSFGVGMTAAWVYVRLTDRYSPVQLSRLAIRLTPIALFALALSVYLFGNEATNSDFKVIAPTMVRTSPWIPLLYSLSLTGAMLVVLIGPTLMRKPFVNAPVRRLGELGYGIFLVHYLIAVYLGVMVLHLPQDGSAQAAASYFVVVLAVSALFSFCSLRFIERPARARAVYRLATEQETPTHSDREEEAAVARTVGTTPLRPSP